ETRMQLWLAMAQSSTERRLVEHHLTDQHVDGVMLLSLHDEDPLPALLAERGLPTVLGGRSARMLAGGDGSILFVDNDNAGGARRALRGRGRAVPGDVAVVGFEDSAVAERTEPPLTTVHQSVDRMGREMVRLLLARIAGAEARSVVLDTHLVVRESA